MEEVGRKQRMGHRLALTLEHLHDSQLAASEEYGFFVGLASQALRQWHELWRNDKRLKSVLCKHELFKEIEEAIVAVTHALRLVHRIRDGSSSFAFGKVSDASARTEKAKASMGRLCSDCSRWSFCEKYAESKDFRCCVCVDLMSERHEREPHEYERHGCSIDDMNVNSASTSVLSCPCGWTVRGSDIGAGAAIGSNIAILKKKYGMQRGDASTVIGSCAADGGLWLLDNGKNVPQSHEGVGWCWTGTQDQSGNKSNEFKKCVVIDVCSGKGIASLLLASSLRDVTGGSAIGRIVMVDLASGHDAPQFDHLDAVKEKPDIFDVPVDFVQLDVHSVQFESFVRSLGDSVVLLGIHLCRRLSSRCVEVFNCCEGVRGIALLPCCLPIKASPTFFLNGVRIDPSELHDVPSPSAAWAEALLQGVNSGLKSLSRAPLSSRRHAGDLANKLAASTFSLVEDWTHEVGKTVITAFK